MKKITQSYLFMLFSLILCGSSAMAQNLIPAAGSTSMINIPSSGITQIFDPGGPGGGFGACGGAGAASEPGNYPNCGCLTTITICPDNPSNPVVLDFFEFDVFANFDYVIIYDNSSASGTELYNNGASGAQNGDYCLTATNFVASNPTGCFTIEFMASTVVDRGGFGATVSGGAFLGPDNAGVSAIDPLGDVCSGTYSVTATIENYGINQIDSVMVNWSVDGSLQPSFWYSNLLDTNSGMSASSASVVLGNWNFIAGQNYDIKAWTTLPNNVADTIDTDDTASDVLSLQAIPGGLAVSNVQSFTADVSWTSQGVSDYVVIYGSTGFDPSSGGTAVSITGASTTIGSLSSNVTYDVYLYADCGSTNSDTIGPVSFTTLCAPANILSGIYTINGTQPTSGNNFTSFSDAADVLNVCGISGPVVFNIAPGTYSESLTLTEIPGASAVNTVTFNGGSVSAVTLTHSSSDDEPTVYLNGADYVTVKNMTISNTSSGDAWGVMLQNGADYNTVDSCFINMPVGTTVDVIGVVSSGSLTAETTTGNNANYFTISNSEIRGGETGVHLEGGPTAGPFNIGNTIHNNVFRQSDDHGIEVDGQEGLTITNNDVDSLVDSQADGIYLVRVNDFNISSNRVVAPDWSAYFLDVNDGFSPTSPSLIINNMFVSETDYGLYLNDAESINVFHNSTWGIPGLALHDQEGIDLRNNIFASPSGFAVDVTDSLHSADVMNYNLYFSGGTDRFDIGADIYTDLPAWQAADPGQNVNSIQGDPLYNGNHDLHATGALANESGDNSVGITVDIDGDPRPSPGATIVDIGADEYLPPSCPNVAGFTIQNLGSTEITFIFENIGDSYEIEVGTCGFSQGGGTLYSGSDPLTVNSLLPNICYDIYARRNCGGSFSGWSGPFTFTTDCSAAQKLSGTYTLDAGQPASATNFQSFDDLFDVMYVCGVDGPVVINIASGTYSGSVELTEIPGASAANTVTFNGGSVAAVTLTHTSSSDEPTVYLNGVDYVTFKNMTIENTSSTDAWGVMLQNGADYNTVDSCLVVMTGTGLDVIGVVSSGSLTDETTTGNNANYFTISNSEIRGGETGVHLEGGAAAGPFNMGNTIHNNIFRQNEDHGIEVDGQEGLTITNNDVDSLVNSQADGLYLLRINDFNISQNRIVAPDYALYILDGNDGNNVNMRSRIVNNMITSQTDYGIYLNDVDSTDVFHNSSFGVPGLALNDQISLDIRNNIFVSTSGYAMDIADTPIDSGTVIDYNIYFTQGANLIQLGTPAYPDLASWQTAFPAYDMNSLQGDPIFESALDLHIAGALANEVGDNSVGVTVDIDGDPRPSAGATIVDIGADEFLPPLCPNVAAYNILDITFEGGTFTFDSEEDNFNIEIGPCGFEQGTGTVNATGQTPLSATGLSPNTCYDLYVRRTCGGGGVSEWSGPYPFRTECADAQKLAGTYTINPSQPASATNFTSFNAIADILNECGVKGPVVVNVASGLYEEQVELLDVVDVSAVNTVVFQADPANTAPVVLQDSATTLATNYVFRFNGTSYITLQGFTMTAKGNTYARVIDMSGDGGHITLTDNIFNGKPSANTSSHNYTVIYSGTSTSDLYDSCVVKHNRINGGSFGIYYNGNAAVKEFGNIADSNEVIGYSWSGISINFQQDGLFRGNTLLSNNSNTTEYGIYSDGNTGIHVIGNKMIARGTTTSYGFYSEDSEGLDENPNIVANNMIGALDNTGTAYGAYIHDNSYMNFYHNTVHVNAGSATAGIALNLNASAATFGNINVVNNIIVNSGPGVAVEINATASTGDYVEVMDYNNFYATGSTLGEFGSTVAADLNAWITASGLDSNSVSGDPVFVSTDDFHVIGAVSNNAGTPLADITTDIDGDIRSLTNPDIGADEYTPLAGDLSLLTVEFRKNSICAVNNDTIALIVKNILGDTVKFSSDPLTVNYLITGPVNSTGSLVRNTGFVAPDSTVDIIVPGVDLSRAGTYTVSAWLNSNSVNNSASNDTLLSAAEITIDTLLKVSPKAYTLESTGDSVLISAYSPVISGGSSFFITEVAHYKYTVGAPAGGWPSYLLADDYIEITGVPGSDLGGVTLEQWSSTAMLSSYTFSSGTLISPNGTAIIAVGQLNSSVESPSDYFYLGGYTGTFSSGGDNGRILKDAGGNIIDAVGVGTGFTFPASSGVTAADWSGFSGNHTTTSGVRLIGEDLNSATNWVVSNVSPQDPNVLNSGVSIPVSMENVSNFTWSLNGTIIDSVPGIYVGPFSTPGDYKYVATLETPCGFTLTDTVVITAPSCPLPGNLMADIIMADSATLSWSSSANATSWIIKYGPSGFDPNTGGTTVNANTNPYRIGGLNELADYEFYVISDCGTADGLSNMAGPAKFSTPCQTIMAPFSESFSNGVLPDCWESYTTTTSTSTNVFWKFTGTATYSTVSASAGSYAWVDGSSPYAETDVTLKTPFIDITALVRPELSFDLYLESSANSNMSFVVNFFDGNSWIDTIYYQVNNLPGGFERIEIPLDVFNVKGPVQFEFIVDKTANGTSALNDIVLDSVVVGNGPICRRSTDLMASGITTDSVTLSWVSPPNANSWTIIYGPADFNPSSGGTSVAVTSNPSGIGGLTANTVYDIYIVSDCGIDGLSEPWGPITIETKCLPFTAPFSEAFSNSALPDCWESYTTTASSSVNAFWRFTGTATYSTVSASAGSYAWVDGSSPFDEEDVTLRTPFVDVSTLTIPQLSFDLYLENTNTVDDNMSFAVNFFDGANWHNSIYYEDDNLPGGFARIELPLDGFNITGPIQFEFVVDKTVNGTSFYNDIVLDNVTVEEGPSCPILLNFGLVSSTSNSATLGWNAGSVAQNYIVEYGVAGFTKGTGTELTTTAASINIGSLTTNIMYEAYLRANCGSGDSSSWVGPISFGALSLCDDMEAYTTTSVGNQSILFKGWYGNGGDAEFSSTRALSGTKSLHIFDTGVSEASDIVATFDPINSGIWDISFSVYVENGAGGYYNVQQNYDPTGVNNLWAFEIYFDSIGTGYVELSDTAFGIFSYTQGQWQRVTSVVDLDNDSTWVEINGVSTGIGWKFTAENLTGPKQFNGVNFYSGVYGDGNYSIDFYVDDFCITDISPCPAPTALGVTNITTNSADVFWTTGGAMSWNVEYGTSGFTPGTGTMVTASNDTLALPGLMDDICYDFYVQDNCGNDSSIWVGPYAFCTEEIIICPDAGADNSVNVCDTIPNVNLSTYLNDADAGGSWIDADGTGALTGSVFDATASAVSHGNTYDFWYILAGNVACPADTAVISVTVDSCKTSGIEENILSNSLNIFPNPTSGDVYVQFETASSEKAQISILDLSGKVIYFEEAGNINGRYEGKVSLNQLAKGTYLLKVESGNLKAVKRIVKQ